MLSKFEAKIAACGAIADLFGVDYFRSHFKDACEAYPADIYDDVEYEYFLGFEGAEDANLWTVFARVLVNRETKECIFLDYKTPDGKRMENPIKPTSFA
ncbi:MAG: hypothetical protein K6F17_00145 [Lachnospiraceae bacterium]|jgi:hypothetical protein|nr:hypothetical protein [Lachnospiraceae bacterium]